MCIHNVSHVNCSNTAASEPSSYDGDESSCSATSLSTAGSKSTKGIIRRKTLHKYVQYAKWWTIS